MAEISVIEFLVYGLIGYASAVMLIISTIKEIPETKSGSISRAVFMIPGIICIGILAGSAPDFNLETSTQTAEIWNGTGLMNATVTETKTIQFVNPVWIYFHWMMFSLMILFVLFQFFQLFTKKD